jgi:uncharacterized protein
MSNSSNLYRLQQVDSHLDQSRSRLVEIESILNDSTVITEANGLVVVSESALMAGQKNLRHIEIQVSDQKFKIEQNESTLYGGRIRNPKELQDLQTEAVALKRYLNVLEDRQLEAMLEVEELEQTHKEALMNLNQVRGRFEEEHAHLRAERARLNLQVEKLSLERQAAISSISAEDQLLYDQLRQSRNGVAVTRVVDQSCSACGSMLTPALAQSAHSINQIVRCTSCSRILYAG